ncbi:hypothetical protein CTI12_AA122840 [Artemisia annua]|uniref:Uncharacterized protein n=1 Tax=Artemisia annua TaxID=35608 RepID=A0A2U1PQM7_ARTAN|nr:hypothetical protein CTI12_AA122840 [Artemisia annua]
MAHPQVQFGGVIWQKKPYGGVCTPLHQISESFASFGGGRSKMIVRAISQQPFKLRTKSRREHLEASKTKEAGKLLKWDAYGR